MKETAKWAATSAAIIIIIFFCIPVNIYKSLLYLVAIAGAVAFTYTMLKLLGSIFLKKINSAVKNPNLTDEERKAAVAAAYRPSGCTIMLVILALFFSFSFLIIVRESFMEENELDNYGQVTNATVVTGSSYSSRKFDFTSIVLAFKKADGDSAFISHSISAREFPNFYRHETVPIVYSTRHPSILKILQTSEEMNKYLKPRVQ